VTLANWQEELRDAKDTSDETKEDCYAIRKTMDSRFSQVLKPLHQVCIQLGLNPSGMLFHQEGGSLQQVPQQTLDSANMHNYRSGSAARQQQHATTTIISPAQSKTVSSDV